MRRKAIKSKDILRVPIQDPKQVFLKKCREKRDQLEIMGNATDDDVFAVAYYYSYKVRELYNLTGFNAISRKDPYNHKNWNHFAKVCNICIKNNWDTFIFIDSQFDRAGYWDNSDGRIFVQQLYSDRAIAHYHRYIKGKLEEHEADGTTLKASKVKTVYEEITDTLIQDCKLIKSGIDFSHIDGTDTEKKIFTLYNNWLSLSAYYLCSSDWLTETLQEYCLETQNAELQKVLSKVTIINENKKLKQATMEILNKIENKFNLPKTPLKDELLSLG